MQGRNPLEPGNGPHPVWHLEDLEVVPHPGGANVILDEFFKYQEKCLLEKNYKTKTRLVFYNIFHFVITEMKMLPGSIRTVWYKGSAENK